MTRVILFDIDGTLLQCGGAGKQAMLQSLREVSQVVDQPYDIPFRGRTDRFLLNALLAGAGIEPTVDRQGQLRVAYRDRLPEWLQRSQGGLLPGVQELLERLRLIGGLELALLTGNLPETARLKLQHFGVRHFFWFGVFGDRHEDRRELAYEARQQPTARLGAFDSRHTLIVGDTPDDVECAKAIGAISVACCTGGFSNAELRRAGADHVFETLEPTPALLRVLIGEEADLSD